MSRLLMSIPLSAMVALCFFSCSSRPPASEQQARLRHENQKRFERLLSERDVNRAARFATYFSPPQTNDETALLAQYHLLVCQPRTAERYINALENQSQRDLYLAVLYGLVAIERPETQKTEVPQNAQSAKRIKTSPPLRFPLDKNEIWRDEWADIGITSLPCHNFPIAVTAKERRQYQELAKNLFLKMPSRFFLADLNLVALALDVGVIPNDIFAILKKFKSKADNAYYRRLLAMAQEPNRQTQDAIAVSAIGKSAITMTGFNVREQLNVTHAIEIPVVTAAFDEKSP